MVAQLRWRRSGQRHSLAGNSAALLIGGGTLGVILALCVLVPILDPHGTDALVALPFQPPSWTYPFGTDEVGRDVFVRTFAGGRLDLGIAAIVVGAAFTIGTLAGVVTATTRSRVLRQLV